MKKIFATTQDYNAYIITDGVKGWLIPDFNEIGTEEYARNHDISGIEGSETWEYIAEAMGTEPELFDYNEDEFESIVELGTL